MIFKMERKEALLQCLLSPYLYSSGEPERAKRGKEERENTITQKEIQNPSFFLP